MSANNTQQLLLGNGRHSLERNTCYANSATQLLRVCGDFMEILRDIEEKTVVEKLLTDVYQFIGSENVTTTVYLRCAIGLLSGKDYYAGRFEDGMEFLSHLVSLLSPDLQSLFTCVLRKQTRFRRGDDIVRCICNMNPEDKIEFESSLSFELPNADVDCFLEDWIADYFKTKSNDEGEGLRCRYCCSHGSSSDHRGDKRCKNKDFSTKRNIVKAPAILLAQAKRFQQDATMATGYRKKTNLVHSPLELNVDGYKYKLQGILCHDNVHYYSKIKISDHWFICDDDKKPQQLTGSLNSPVDYVFLYLKIDDPNKPTFVPTAEYQEIPTDFGRIPSFLVSHPMNKR